MLINSGAGALVVRIRNTALGQSVAARNLHLAIQSKLQMESGC